MDGCKQELELAWRSFVAGKDSGLDRVRPAVRESWTRCRRYAVDPGIKEAPLEIASEAQLSEVRRRSRLFQAARALLPVIGHCLTGSPCFIGLYDDRGLTLDALSFEQAKKVAENAKAVSGARWIEREVGTDAVPTCLVLGVPVEIGASEHYVEAWHNWWGAAAPVRDPFTKRMVGVLGLYGYVKVAHLRTLALVTDFAAAIERELRTSLLESQLAVFKKYEEYTRKLPTCGVVAIGPNGHILSSTPTGLQALGLSHERLKNGMVIQDLLQPDCILEPDPIMAPKELFLRGRGGERMKADVLPVMDQDRSVGLLAILPQFKGTSSDKRVGHGWHARYRFSNIVGQHSALRSCIAQAERIAALDLPVLIRGETGTGKELFAHSIHNASPRALGPFVTLNCGAVSEELLAAELFGYSEGAFTGAVRGGKAGKFQLADRGTLFLDEIESASLRVQTHLLRALEEDTVTPVGGEKPKAVDVRVLAATNINLTAKVKDGTFRQDLYYRLNCASLLLPPLRERATDVRSLAQALLGNDGPELGSEVVKRLEGYCWPGNVRELRNIVEQSAIKCSGDVILESDLPAAVCSASCRTSQCPFGAASLPISSGEGTSILESAERDIIIRLLSQLNGNLSQVAAYLKIDRSTLYRKLKRHNIQTMTNWH